MTYLSNNHYAISDKTAAVLAREHAAAKRLPRPGYQVDVKLSDGHPATLKRSTLLFSDTIRRKRGWVWTLMPY